MLFFVLPVFTKISLCYLCYKICEENRLGNNSKSHRIVKN